MTAIAGFRSFGNEASVSRSCQGMLRALSVYGGDRCTHYSDASIALGVSLLPLLPEDRFDQQPLSAGGVSCLVADVRLDNRDELARALSVSTAAVADSVLLLAAWRRWGEQCVEHLTGAFSFAVWSEPEQHLFLARDHTGERPLYYASTDGWFAFASMPSGLRALPFLAAELDEDYLARLLALANTPIEQTIFRHIRRLPPGCALSVRGQKTRMWRHWETANLKELCLGSPEAYLDCFRERFDRAVRARLRTTGNVGAHLSGGLDSSSVAATAAQLLSGEGRDLTCFTAVPRDGFTPPASETHFHDEGPAAAQVAALYPNMRHVLVQSSETSFLDILDRSNGLYNHPCQAPSNEVWVNAIYDQARDLGVTVMLSGRCGNSTISYEGMHALSFWFRSGQWATLGRVGRQLVANKHCSVRYLVRNAVWPSLPFWLRSKTDPHMRGFSLEHSVLRPEIAKQLDLERRVFRDHNLIPSDGRSQLLGHLEEVDTADCPTLALGGWQMDFRDPTFDRNVIEFCLTVPIEEFLRDGQRRSLTRRGMVGRLPESTLRRTQRGLQSADWHLDLIAVRDRMKAEVERLQTSPLAGKLLDLTRMRSLIDGLPSDGFSSQGLDASHYIGLTRGFSVGRFLLQYDQR